MKQDLHLYIGEQEVEFQSTPDILYTYQEDDLTNPTVVKNSFTKTITIEGTPNNNKIFGDFWNVERLQGSDGGGVSFNASKKAPFTLYLDHDIYESGYAKLDNVTLNGRSCTYDITLYGGLGDFFYNLSINEDGDALQLKDLNFGGGSDEFNFTINMDTVKTAWDSLKSGNAGMWDKINFMPAYNGKPEDFDSDKVIINTKGTTLTQSKSEDGKNYTTRQGFVLGELPDEMTEWETRDLRSYLQRPVIRMKSIVEACCNQENNGGYEVILDPDFFNDKNPYYKDTWVTLPMIQALEYSSEEQILEGARLVATNTSGNLNGLFYRDLQFDLGEFSQSTPSSINIWASIKINGVSYRHTSWMAFMGPKTDNLVWGRNSCFGSLFVQIIALNGDTVVGASDAYNLTSPIRHNGKLYYGHNGRYGDGHKYDPYMGKPIYDVLGTFERDGFTREGASTPASLYFNINNINSNITDLKMVMYWGYNKEKSKDDYNGLYMEPYDNWDWGTGRYWSHVDNINSYETFNISSNIKAVLGESIGRTGTQVNKTLLLSTEGSPCDYLLSYTKMFGLYFTKDIESNKVYIQTRKSFYKRNEIKDMREMIDRGKDMSMTPLTFDSKWYQFSQEMDETSFAQNYQLKRGIEFGSKILNTGYEFAAEKKQLLEGNVLKSGIEGLEKSKYFTAFTNDKSVRPWFGYGLTYSLYNGEDSIDVKASTRNAGDVLPINENDGMKYYDVFPKLQFHKNGDGTDGNNVLVFFNGFKEFNADRNNLINYILSDDTAWQTQLNEGTPCWLFTAVDTFEDKRICIRLDSIPVFERYKTSKDSGKVNLSLDFGSSQDLYVPSYSITDDVNVYANYWKTYLEDLYDVNNRVMSCYCKLDGKPSEYWLRRFYWFDNCLWRITKITDWNVSSYDTVKVDFVKVQDINSYTSISQDDVKTITLTASSYGVSYKGQTITLTVEVGTDIPWRIICDNPALTLSRTSGVGPTTLTGTFAPWTPSGEGRRGTAGYRLFYITAIRNDNAEESKITIRQNYQGATRSNPNISRVIVSAQGGEVSTEFEWTNQDEGRYMDDVVTKGGISEGDVDITTERTANRATTTVRRSAATTVRSSEVTFLSRATSTSLDNDTVETTIYIDQLPEYLECSGEGGASTITFAYVKEVEFQGVPSWVNSVTDDDNGTYVFNAAPNPYGTIREAQVIAINKENPENREYFTIRQGMGNVSDLALYRIGASGDVSPKGGTITLKVECGKTPWTLTADKDFVTIHTTTGTSMDAKVNVDFETNNGEWRDTIFTLTDASGEHVDFTVAQDGASGGQTQEGISPSVLYYNLDGGSQYAFVNFKEPWTIESEIDWATVSTNWGFGSSLINVTVGATTAERYGQIKVRGVNSGKVLGTITVVQSSSQDFLIVEPQEVVYGAEGGTQKVKIISSRMWTIDEN